MAAPASPTICPRNASSFLGSTVCAWVMPPGRDFSRHEVTNPKKRRSRVVTTEIPGLDRPLEVLGEGGAVLADPREDVEEPLPDVDPRLFGRGGSLASATPE